MDPSSRSEHLSRACGEDLELREEVESLLSESGEGSFLDEPVVEAMDFPSMPDSGTDTLGELPEQIAGYRILGVLGAGGMGVVYRAEQEHPQRTVALKVIRPGVTSQRLLRRFEFESETLGRLSHPNIAQVFEAGAADTGFGPQPFFAMELIEGAPLLEAAERRKLDLRARVRLLARICRAAHHAHQKGVIHRDLKPANVLVNGAGEPKIVDFGVARATDSDIQCTTVQTDIGQLIGTAPYMSPEQVEGDASSLDSRSDVYTLGVLGFELLTGRLPYDLDGKSLVETCRTISEDEPRRASSIDRRLRGDLELILRKALEKDRDRRYQSAAELAADLDRYLDDEPVEARPPSAWYQARKFTKRHTGLVAGIGGAVGILIAALIVVSILYADLVETRNAESAAQQEALDQASITSAVNVFLNDDLLAAVNPENTLNPEITVREALDNAAARIEGRFDAAPLVEASIRNTLGVTYESLGRFDLAAPHLERAIELVSVTRGPDHTETLGYRENLAGVYERLGEFGRAESILTDVLSRRSRVEGADAPATLAAQDALANIWHSDGRWSDAIDLWERTLDGRRAVLGVDHYDTLITMNNLAAGYTNAGRYEDAERMWSEMLDRGRDSLGDNHPDTLVTMNNLSVLYDRMGRFDESERMKNELLAIHRQIMGDEHPRTLSVRNNLGVLYFQQSRYEEAAEQFESVLEARRRTLGESNPQTQTSIGNLAMVYQLLDRLDDAAQLGEEHLELRRASVGPEHPATLGAARTLANIYRALHRYDDALRLFDENLPILVRTLGEDHPQTLAARHGEGSTYLDRGDADRAFVVFEDAASRSATALGAGHPTTLRTRMQLARTLMALNRHDDSLRQYEDILSVDRDEGALGPDDRAEIHFRCGEIHHAQSRPDDAERSWLEAARECEATTAATSSLRREIIERLVAHYRSRGEESAANDWAAKVPSLNP